MNRIDARNVSHLWDGQVGLHPIDVQVAAGELVVVRGRSGSGKSTLLAVLAGLCPTDTGELAAPAPGAAWQQVALVPQVLALAVELSVRENITDSGGDDAVLTTLRLDEMADRAVTDISMGQQQRVAVARAVAVQPEVLLADEPTSFQDDLHTDVVVAALRAAAAAGTAVLVATHDPAMIAAADRIIDIHAE